MQRIPAREYARRHKMSLFQVIKKIQNGELQGEQIEENGLKIQYVLLPEASSEPARNNAKHAKSSEKAESSPPSGEESLHAEIQALREELRELKILMKRCCEKIAESEKRNAESAES
jgi:hypothetical protein